MKCIAIIATLVVAALAEPEAYYGYGSSGLGYGYGSGYGAGYGYAGRQYGLVSSRPYAVSAPIVKSAPIVAQAPAVPVAAPVQYASTSSLRAVPSAPSTSQYHKQDELANFEYGYDNVNSAATQSGNAYTGVAGTYTVKHPAPGRTISYVADGLGFRVTAEHRGKRSVAVVPSTYATAPGTMMVIKYNPGFSTGYRVFH